MKKLSYLASAVVAALGFSTAANADVSVSGAGSLALVNDGGNSTNEIVNGGSVSFALSTTTSNGLGIAMGMGITRATDAADPDAAATGAGSVTFTTGGNTIVVGAVGTVGAGTGSVGGVTGDVVGLADGVAAAASTDLTETTGSGVTLATTVGGASLTIGYIYDASGADNLGNLDSDATATGIAITMPVGDMSVSLGYATATDTNSETDIGASVAYAAAGGTLTVGYGNASLNAGDATTMGVSYAMDLDADTSLAIGYNSTKDATNSNTTMEASVSRSLGGGASLFLDIVNVSGDGANTGSAFAVGTSVSF